MRISSLCNSYWTIREVWKRYYVTELKFFGLAEITRLIVVKKDKLKIQEFEELLFLKSSIPTKRWRAIMGEKKFKKRNRPPVSSKKEFYHYLFSFTD